jgi:hypothetical protein
MGKIHCVSKLEKEPISEATCFIVWAMISRCSLKPSGWRPIIHPRSETSWAGWLLELYRVTAPNGLLIITFMGEGMSQGVAGEPWNPQDVGMNVYEAGQEWEQGGPMVLHSPWWIRDHWGRLFDVERLQARGFGGGEPAMGQHDHGVVVLRKTAKMVDFAELERLDPAEPRETTALYHDVQHVRAEVADLRQRLGSTRRVQEGADPAGQTPRNLEPD